MKKYAYIGISFIILVFGVIFVPKIVSRIQQTTIVSKQRTLDLDKLAYLQIDGKAKKIPEFALYNQDSLLITNHDYRNKVVVVKFFFTSCPTICPKMTRNFVFLQDSFAEECNFGLVSFTINPVQDTPMHLKKYAERYGVTHPNWNFLTGDRAEIYRLAKEGFTMYAAENPKAPGGFAHSGYFALVDKKGFLRSRYDAAGNPKIYYKGTAETKIRANQSQDTEVHQLLEDIKKLLQEK